MIKEIIKKHFAENIILTCSGGADSSMLLFETCKAINELKSLSKVYVFTLGTDPKDRFNARCANAVINVIAKHFNNNYPIVSHQVFYAPAQEQKYFDKHMDKIKKNYRITVELGATSLPPPAGVSVINSDGILIDMYDPLVSYRYNLKYTNQNGNVTSYLPYYKTDKVGIIKKYKDYGILDTLLPVTRSCESLNAKETNNHTTECGKCWWCLERKWAIDSNCI